MASSWVTMPTSMSSASTIGMAIRSYFWIFCATSSWSSSTRAKIRSACMTSSIRAVRRERISFCRETEPISRRR